MTAVWLAIGFPLRAQPGAPATDPGHPLTIELPANFRRLPELGAAAAAAAAAIAERRDGVAVSATAWGDPAMGCYTLVEQASFPATTADVDAVLRSALGSATQIQITGIEPARPAPAGASDSATPAIPAPGDRTTFTFTGGGFQGTGHARVRRAGGRSSAVDLVACFYNQRYRQRSRALCAALLEPWVTSP